jgi:hypothetical protein
MEHASLRGSRRGFNFYWSSWTDSIHSRNIRYNPNVCLVIYDSTVPEGTGRGVYATAQAYELAEPAAVEQALRYYYGRVDKPPPKASVFLGNSPRRIYVAVPRQFWMNTTAVSEECRLTRELQLL